MRALLQRVSRASVTVDGRITGRIERGLLIFLGVENGDTDAQLDALARKIQGLRVFEDDAGKMNLSCEDIGGAYLCVSQFTLCADLSRGKRPGFEAAMRPPQSKEMWERFCGMLGALTGRPVERGEFGADMKVELLNDGPATFWLNIPTLGG